MKKLCLICGKKIEANKFENHKCKIEDLAWCKPTGKFERWGYGIYGKKAVEILGKFFNERDIGIVAFTREHEQGFYLGMADILSDKIRSNFLEKISRSILIGDLVYYEKVQVDIPKSYESEDYQYSSYGFIISSDQIKRSNLTSISL